MKNGKNFPESYQQGGKLTCSEETDGLIAPFARHLSLEESLNRKQCPCSRFLRISLCAAVLIALLSCIGSRQIQRFTSTTIDEANEDLLEVDPGIRIWYRTWGNPQGTPVLFVHGGPGNAISDYDNGNARFFDYQTFFVIEVDQRGTGKSQPSVRDSWENMRFYLNISIDQMAEDYETLRQHLKIEQWLVFGGSWGSTLALVYGTSYPDRCLALILRGIYLNTKPEFFSVFARDSYLGNPKRLAEFDSWFAVAAKEQAAINSFKQRNESAVSLDPNDAETFFHVYEHLIQRGDRHAIWHWHAFENNLMEEDPANLLNPDVINETFYPEAQSVAFFEARLYLHGTFEDPVNLLDRASSLKNVPVWICQGRHDEVCPPEYAQLLADQLNGHVPLTFRMLEDAGHEQTDEIMARCLQSSLTIITV